jgi:very-short-patch-repair endonuclease
MSTPTPGRIPPVDENRKRVVDAARQQWIRKLIDPSRRNNLLYFRELKSGTLNLSSAPAEVMGELLTGETIPLQKVLGKSGDGNGAEVVREIARKAQSNAEEKGLQTLFLALGMASWRSEDEGRPPSSPVLLIPIKITGSGRSDVFHLARSGNAQVNLVLLHALEGYGVSCSPEVLLSALQGDDESVPFDPQPLFDRLTTSATPTVDSFTVSNDVWLGNFAFQKMAMVKDIQERANELCMHDLVAAIAGDTTARIAAGERECEMDPKSLDRTPPENEFFVLDADSSQQCAVGTVTNGASAVVHGPPGTGKSQTIVNLVATLAAKGKRVLFVAEKRAALEVVLRRLRSVGLEHLAIDLHGADVTPKRVMEQVGRALNGVRNATPVVSSGVHSQVVDRRARLNAHVERMHTKRLPAQKSVYELQGLLLRLSAGIHSKTRWRGAELLKLTPEVAQRVRDLLKEAGAFESLVLRTDPSPWTGTPLPDGQSVRSALDLVQRLNQTTIPAFFAAQAAVLQETSLTAVQSISELRRVLTLVGEIQLTLKLYSPRLFGQDLDEEVRKLRPAQGGRIQLIWTFITDSAFRASRNWALSLRTQKAGARQLCEELTLAADQQARWRVLGLTSLPRQIDSYNTHSQTLKGFWTDFDLLKSTIARDCESMTLDELGSLVRRLAEDTLVSAVLPKVNTLERSLLSAGVGNLLSEIRTERSPALSWERMFDAAWYQSTLDDAAVSDPEIGGFKGVTHAGFVSEFVELDIDRIEIAASRVSRAHAERAIAAMNAFPGQELALRAETQRARKFKPLRRLFAETAEVLTAVCPCWMASPLSVSQLLDSSKKYFDYVIFDEASQVLPEDAVCSILRGEKLVVAGDRNQLPPTTFFAASTEDESDDDNGESDGFESLLDMANAFLPSTYLDWHYRSRDEALIAFSNHHIYLDRLVTFPGPGGTLAISHVLVEQESGIDGQEESAATEVRRVIECVIDHAKNRSSETLGVITMGIKHRNRIQAALDKSLKEHSGLEAFFDESRVERFFIKNLEAVQGDERDAIIISVGYGKDRAGNLPFRFGPLLSEGGRRRLNVAITRARTRVTLISSFSHLDMDLTRVRKGTGVELLRNYIEYAASGGKRLGEAAITDVSPNDFEQDIYDALTARGLRLIPQFGASQYRIDLVAEHPKKPGLYVLAIECDGTTYHSSCTARDRDRLRQHQLENLGWHFHRIWSTDWFMHKEQEVSRAVAAFEEAVKQADLAKRSGDHGSGNGSAGSKQEQSTPSVQTKARGAKPIVTGRAAIVDYSTQELVQLIRWVQSDGLLRSDDELVAEMVDALDFARRGVRIESRVRQAIRSASQPSV